MKVLILFGGVSAEHYVSCKSACSIASNIDSKLFSYELCGISKQNCMYQFQDDLELLRSGKWMEGNIHEVVDVVSYIKRFDVVFPIIHGVMGEDGTLQGLLDSIGVPYVGSKVLASALGMDKAMSKIFIQSLAIPQVPYSVLCNGKGNINNLVYPLIVKPANGGSSIGITKVENEKEFALALEEAQKFDKKIVIEEFKKVRELEVAVLEVGNVFIQSRIGEIKAASEYYDYAAKYDNPASLTMIAEDLSNDVKVKIEGYVKKIIEALDVHGYARVDFFYEEESESIYFNEINTIPGFTEISMFPKLMEDRGIQYSSLLTLLLLNA